VYFNGIKSIKNKRSGYKSSNPESSSKGQIGFSFSIFSCMFIPYCEPVSTYLGINKPLIYFIFLTTFIVLINVAISKYLSSPHLIKKYKGLYLGHKFKKEKFIAENSILVLFCWSFITALGLTIKNFYLIIISAQTLILAELWVRKRFR